MERILVTIPHYFSPARSGRHGSLCQGAQLRRQALWSTLASVRRLFGHNQSWINIEKRETFPANNQCRTEIRVIICTTDDKHLLDESLLGDGVEHRETGSEPHLLGFSCHDVLAEHLGSFDWYCYLEDDLQLFDPQFLLKIDWFSKIMGKECLLMPNRFETSGTGPLHKVYIDGDLAPRVTAPFQNRTEHPAVQGRVMGRGFNFLRPSNPHSGCFFLSAKQMRLWAEKPWFGKRDTSFVGPLESAATLGIMRTFRVYKPSFDNASFLEIQHFGTAFLNLFGKSVLPLDSAV